MKAYFKKFNVYLVILAIVIFIGQFWLDDTKETEPTADAATVARYN